MLQQTQVDRVIPKYKNFFKRFPNLKTLASARQSSVLKEWQGLGYNRRAVNLKRTAEIVRKEFGGKLPDDQKTLESLPGIGPYTASALRTFIWNKSVPLIETNIRAVFLYHFFPKKKEVHDKQLLPLIEQTLDTKNPREWYYALMDYGVHLKKTIGNANTRSKHYTKQPTFKGSNRELRGKILRALAEKPATLQKLARTIQKSQKDAAPVIHQLIHEGFLIQKTSRYHLK